MTADPFRDDRGDLPSGSAAERWMNCSGSFAIEATMPDESTPEAQQGEKLHGVMEGKVSIESLTEEEKELTDTARGLEGCVVRDHIPEFRVACREKRWWVREDTTLLPVASTRIDSAYYDPYTGRLVIVDYKFGYGVVENATTNPQLRVQAVAGAEEFGAKEVIVAIIQPRADREHRLVIAQYDEAALKQARAEVIEAAKKAVMWNRDDVTRKVAITQLKAGPWCKWCKFLARCPTAKESIGTLLSHQAAKELAGASITELSDTDMDALLTQAEVAENLIGLIQAEGVRRLQANPDALNGKWRLPTPQRRRKIEQENTPRVAELLADKMDTARLLALCEVSPAVLEEAYAKLRDPKTTKKDAIAELATRLDGIIAVKFTEPKKPVRAK